MSGDVGSGGGSSSVGVGSMEVVVGAADEEDVTVVELVVLELVDVLLVVVVLDVTVVGVGIGISDGSSDWVKPPYVATPATAASRPPATVAVVFTFMNSSLYNEIELIYSIGIYAVNITAQNLLILVLAIPTNQWCPTFPFIREVGIAINDWFLLAVGGIFIVLGKVGPRLLNRGFLRSAVFVDDVVDAQLFVLSVEDLLEPGVAVSGEDLVKVVNVVPNILLGDGFREVNADDEDTVVCGDWAVIYVLACADDHGLPIAVNVDNSR